MVTLKEFIEKSVPAWQAAKAYVQCLDNIENPTEFKTTHSDLMIEKFLKGKLSSMGLNESDIKFHVLFNVSDDSINRVGYMMMHVYLRSDKSVLCVEFVNCTDSFLNSTKLSGMVNGVAYKSRKSLNFEHSEVFFF